MSDLFINFLLVLLFIFIGSLFAASEMALVSLRDTQIQAMAQKSKAGSKIQALTEDQNRFLSAVQVGVTLAGFFSASFGAAEIAPLVVPTLVGWGMSSGAAATTAFIATTIFISYLSIVLGELVPKRMAMQSAETFARLVAYPLSWIVTFLRPVIWFLGVSTNVVLRLFGRNPEERREEMDSEELRSYVAGHEGLDVQERAMVVDLLSVGARTVEEIMTPRTEVEFFDADTEISEAQAAVASLEHSRYPVRHNNDDDDVLGFVHIRDLIKPSDDKHTIRDLVRPIMFFPTGKPVLAALTEMRAANAHLAIVVDEYGGTDGIITLEDVVEEFVGEIHDEYDREAPEVITLEDGGEVSGLIGRAETLKYLQRELPEGPYDTLAGYIIEQLGRMAEVGDVAYLEDLELKVMALDGRRIDRVHVSQAPKDPLDIAEEEINTEKTDKLS